MTCTCTETDCPGAQFTVSGTWSSSNTSVMTVSTSGLVTGVSVGTATISVDLGFIPVGTGCIPNGCPTGHPVPNTGGTVSDFTVSPLNADVWDGNQGSFSVSITAGTASSYQWSFTSPAGAGNNPNVNFSASTSAQTNTDSHWFALPNVSCPWAGQPGAPARLAPYTIQAAVVFQGNPNAITHTATLNSDFVWTRTGSTGQADITGNPTMAADPQGVWRIKDIGNMTRVLPVPQIFVPTTSQFYNKSNQHEQVHVAQWNPGRLFGDLYIVSDLFNLVANFTGTSQADLQHQYDTAKANYFTNEVSIFASRATAAEHEAYQVSDAIAPQYMIQNCGRF